MSDTATPIVIVPVQNEGELFQALAIREVVFIEEQSVPESLERDAEDATAFHVLAMKGKHAVGTGRLWVLPAAPGGEQGPWGRVGRMAVLSSDRQSGVGAKLLEALEAEARKRGLRGILLHAQLSAMEFYKRHGYEAHGAVFEEAGMPHLEMKKLL
ncbi:MAG: GNAT family N-acetyltransferase [Myxococcaceae bacterium]|nr:GNAT family N-acetyltransferase [Myxococcaceae bacterium]